MNYLAITKDDMLNGDGLRVVLWVAGCSHHCHKCQNPYSWDCNAGIPFDENAKEELFEQLEKDYISGITFSGGDPLYEKNANEVMALCYEIKEKFPTKTIWLYTGYTFEEIKHLKLIPYVDVIVDGEYKEELRDITLPFRGSSNQRIIKVKELK